MEKMNQDFFDALLLLEKEKGISAEYLLEKIKNAIVIAIKRDYGNVEDVVADIDKATGKYHVAIRKRIVEEVNDPTNEMLLEEARKLVSESMKQKDPDMRVTGDLREEGFVDLPLETKQFGRIAAQTAKHVIKQGIREAERGQMLQEFQSREHEIVSATIQRVDPKKGSATLEIGRSEAVLQKSEQIPGEVLREGAMIKVYVVEVSEGDRGPRPIISRTHPGLVKRLFEMEVPEIFDGTVEVKAISREAGSRSKLAVWSRDPNVDAVGACIGPKGNRVAKIVEELGGEKIDVIKFSEQPEEFIAAALSPAEALSVTVAEDGSHACRVVVPDSQLSLAIGNKGQNARLAARLTGWKIDIRPQSGFFGDEEEGLPNVPPLSEEMEEEQ